MSDPLNLGAGSAPDKVVELRRDAVPGVESLKLEEESISLRDVLNIVRRRRRILLTTAAVILLATAVQVFTVTPLYRATVLVQIDHDQSQVLPYQPLSEGGTSHFANQEYLRTVVENLETRALATRVVERLDLVNRPEFNDEPNRGLLVESTIGLAARAKSLLGTVKSWLVSDEAGGESVDRHVSRLLANLEVQWLKDTRLLEVAYFSPDAKFSAEVANALVDEFIAQHNEQQYEAVGKVAQFLGVQLENLKQRVEESERALLEYARENDIVSSDELESIDVKKLADLTDELTMVESDLTEKAAKYQAIQSATTDSFPPSLSNPTIDTIESRLATLKGERAEFSSQRGPNWPGLKALEEEIRQLEQELDVERQAALNEARSEYQLAVDRRNRLQRAADAQRDIVDSVKSRSIQYNILKRDVETNQGLYEGLLLRLKEAGVATGLQSGNIFVTDPASVPRMPATPKRLISLALALVVGVGLGIVLALVAEGLDDSVKTMEDVTQGLRLPGLASIPSMVEESEPPRRRLLPIGGDGPGGEEAEPILAGKVEGELSYRAREAYRLLRTSLLLSHSDRPPRTILVTSALPSDGKTTTAANLAIAMSQMGARTVLLDLDMRSPDLGKLFRASERTGLSSYLSGNADLRDQLIDTAYPQLQLVTAGPPAPNPTELILSQRMTAGLRYLRENHTYIVIDSPPALDLADALALSRLVDGVIVVARSGKTPKDALTSLVGRLTDARAQLLGVVINDVDYRKLGYGSSRYRYAYAYYSGYGQSAEKASET